MSLFGQYIYERQNKSILEDEFGFATYYFQNDCCYIEDIYVVKEKRKENIASKYADKIAEEAKAKGMKYLVGSVKPSTNGSTVSLKVLLGYGFQLVAAQEDFIWFKKEI